MKYLKALKIALACIVIVSVSLFIAATDLARVKTQLSSVGLGFIGVLFASTFSYLLGAMAWKYCFVRDEAIPLQQLFFTRTIAENVSMFNPTNIVAGETVKYQLLKNVKITKQDKIQSIILSRTVLITSQVGLALIMVFWLLRKSNINVFSISEVWLALLSIVVILKVLVRLLTADRLRLWLRNKTWLHQLIINLTAIYRGLKLFVCKNPGKLGLAYLFSILHWFVGAAELCWILYLLDITPSFLGALSVDMGVIVLKSLGGFVPGQLGVEEMGNKWMLSVIGIQGATIWVSVSIIRRARQLCWIAVSALFYFIPCYLNKRKTKHGNIIYHT